MATNHQYTLLLVAGSGEGNTDSILYSTDMTDGDGCFNSWLLDFREWPAA
jgi:hypothetical protein